MPQQIRLSRKNYIDDLANLSRDERISIFPTLTFSSDTRIKNKEIESSYYWSDPGLAVFKSLFLAIKLDSKLSSEKIRKKLNNKNYMSGFLKTHGFSSVEKFHEALFLVFEIFRNNKGVIKLKKVIIHLKAVNNIKKANFSEIEINDRVKDVLKIISFISITVDIIKSSYKYFKQKLTTKTVLLDSINPFYGKPILEYKENEESLFICPSLYLLLIKINRLFFSLLYQYNQSLIKNYIEIEKENIEKYIKTINNEIGKSYEAYINDILRHYAEKIGYQFFNLDDEKQKISDGKRSKILQRIKDEKGGQIPCADFIIETDNYIVIVECKNSIGLRDPFYKNYSHPDEPHPLLSSWNRMHGSFLQCFKTKNNLHQDLTHKRKMIFYLVVVNEMVVAEAAVFGMYVYHAKLSHQSIKIDELDLKFGEFSMISLPMFDYLIASGSLENFAKTCEENAKLLYNEKDENKLFDRIEASLNILLKPIKHIDPSFWKQE